MAANPAEAGPVAEVPPGTSVAGQAGEGRLARADEPAGPGEPGESGDSTELGEPAGPGDPAACCGARTRGGAPCGAVPMANGRCRIHGGTSTGPRTMEGMARMIASKTTHGRDGPAGAPKRAAKLAVRRVIVRGQLLSAASDLRAYLPAAMAARLALPVLELAASPHWSHSAPQLAADLADLLNSATTPGSSAEGQALGPRRWWLDRRGTCLCVRCRAARPWSAPPSLGPPCGQIGPCTICATTLWMSSGRGHALGTRRRRLDRRETRSYARRRTARSWSAPPPEAAVRAMWPLHDLRNNPRDERPGACPRGGGGWIAGRRVLARVAVRPDPGQRHPARGRRASKFAPARFAQRPPGQAPEGMPSGARGMSRATACRCARTRWWAWCRAAAGAELG